MKEKSPEPFINKPDQEKPLDIDYLFNLYETEEGQEYFTYQTVMAGYTTNPKYVELAIRRCEREADQYQDKSKRDYKKETAFLIIEAFGLPDERKRLVEENMQKFRSQYQEADKDYAQLEKQLYEEKKKVLENIGVNIRDLQDDWDLALKKFEEAEEKKDYQLAAIIAQVCNIATFNAKKQSPNLFIYEKYYKEKLNKIAPIWDKRNPQDRRHSLNLAMEYLNLGDYEEASKRSEPNNPHFIGRLKDILEEPPADLSPEKITYIQNLYEKHKQMWEATWTILGDKRAKNLEDLREKIKKINSPD